MSSSPSHAVADLRGARLTAAEYAVRLADAVPPLTSAQAVIEAERCLYCHDAPCTIACPTGIDVPTFIRRIAQDNLRGAARTILESNPLGGMCARVCPTEELCEQACVRNVQSGEPIAIGRLQRHAVDAQQAAEAGGAAPLFVRAPDTGRRVAVVGAGPAGLACAHGLAGAGHQVTVFDAADRPGGLNEYGLATYKTAGGYAQREIAWLLSIGGIAVRTGWRMSGGASLQALRDEFDAVFLGLGLGDVHRMGIAGESLAGVRSAVDFIAELRQAADPAQVAVGRRVVVIGGGMTAIDAAVQARLLGAEDVRIAYRRGPAQMPASGAEQEWAQTRGVAIRHGLAPAEIVGDGRVEAVRFACQHEVDGRWVPTGEHETFEADQVLVAIGQRLDAAAVVGTDLRLRDGRIDTDDKGGTSLAGVWAGGDCRAGGRDLTVEAVEHGKLAARAICAYLAATPATAVA